MADTVESLTAEITTLETAFSRSLAIGVSTAMPGGSTHAPHDPVKLDALIRSKKVRLARLQALEAGRPPFQAQVAP